MTSAREDLHKLPDRSFQFGNSGAERTDSAFQGLNQPPEDLRGCECAVGRFGSGSFRYAAALRLASRMLGQIRSVVFVLELDSLTWTKHSPLWGASLERAGWAS